MELRLAPRQGGDEITHGVGVMNDSGSTIMSLIDADLNYLGDLSRFVGWTGYSTVADAGGRVERLRTMDVDIRLLDQNLIPWSGWFMETAVVRASAPGLIRLSGSAVRQNFYVATPRGMPRASLKLL